MELIPNGITVKPIKGAKNYLAFADGRIYSLKSKRFIGSLNKKKNRWVAEIPYDNKKKKTNFISVLIYETFGELPDDYSRKLYDIHHENKDSADDRLENLSCVDKFTHNSNHHIGLKSTLGRKHTKEARQKMSENHADVSGFKNPMFGLKGENHPASKLTNEQRKEIIIKVIFFHNKGYSFRKCFREIEKDYSVSFGAIRAVWNKWKGEKR